VQHALRACTLGSHIAQHARVANTQTLDLQNAKVVPLDSIRIKPASPVVRAVRQARLPLTLPSVGNADVGITAQAQQQNVCNVG
jgi:hypothetical protein